MERVMRKTPPPYTHSCAQGLENMSCKNGGKLVGSLKLRMERDNQMDLSPLTWCLQCALKVGMANVNREGYGMEGLQKEKEIAKNNLLLLVLGLVFGKLMQEEKGLVSAEFPLKLKLSSCCLPLSLCSQDVFQSSENIRRCKRL